VPTNKTFRWGFFLSLAAILILPLGYLFSRYSVLSLSGPHLAAVDPACDPAASQRVRYITDRFFSLTAIRPGALCRFRCKTGNETFHFTSCILAIPGDEVTVQEDGLVYYRPPNTKAFVPIGPGDPAIWSPGTRLVLPKDIYFLLNAKPGLRTPDSLKLGLIRLENIEATLIPWP